MSTTTPPSDGYATGIDLVDKIHDPDSRAEWRRMMSQELMRAAARRAAERRVALLADSVLDSLVEMGQFPPPLSLTTLHLMVPDGKRVQWAEFSSSLREQYGLSTYEAADHIRRAVKGGVLFMEEEGRLKYLSRMRLTAGIDWERMCNWTRTKGPEVVVNLIQHMDCGETKAYALIDEAIQGGILGEKRTGRTRTLWVKRKDITRMYPDDTVSEPVVFDPDACPEQDDSGLLPPPKGAFPRAFAEYWWAGREQWGRWDAYVTPQELSDRSDIKSAWRNEYYKD